MYSYAAISIGDITIGFVSQYFTKPKKSIVFVLWTTIISGILFFSPLNNNDTSMYIICAALGFSTGFWAIFVTMGAEQFGQIYSATAATTIPNMVSALAPLLNILFKDVFRDGLRIQHYIIRNNYRYYSHHHCPYLQLISPKKLFIKT